MLAADSMRTRWIDRLHTFARDLYIPVDIAPLVFFRIFFGVMMMWETWRYFTKNWIFRYYIEPQFHFTYYWFDWVKPLPGDGMYLVFHIMGFAALLMILGLFYRWAAATVFVLFTYIFLLEQARYLNHFYLISLIAFLMILVPANRAFALDAWLRPKLRSQTMPTWVLWLMRFQVAIPYFFGGVAKLNPDWLQGEPMRMWLSSRVGYPVIGPYLTEEWAVYVFSYGGLLLDLLIVFFLLWQRTRWIAFGFALGFHLMNAYLFTIGIFPWFMIGATLLFLEPRRFRQAWDLLMAIPRRFISRLQPAPATDAAAPAALNRAQWAMVGVLTLWVAFQVFYPLRGFLYPGSASWTEEAHRFSWHMKLRDKDGGVSFYVTDPQRDFTWRVQPHEYLVYWQAHKMAGHPDMILQFAHHLRDQYQAHGYEDIEVRAVALASLNGRASVQLIDPQVDLAKVERSLVWSNWILPLDQPLKRTVVSNPDAESSQ